jgi:hypothetical protein
MRFFQTTAYFFKYKNSPTNGVLILVEKKQIEMLMQSSKRQFWTQMSIKPIE